MPKGYRYIRRRQCSDPDKISGITTQMRGEQLALMRCLDAAKHGRVPTKMAVSPRMASSGASHAMRTSVELAGDMIGALAPAITAVKTSRSDGI